MNLIKRLKALKKKSERRRQASQIVQEKTSAQRPDPEPLKVSKRRTEHLKGKFVAGDLDHAINLLETLGQDIEEALDHLRALQARRGKKYVRPVFPIDEDEL